jgi:hypothetical protein
MKPICRSCLVRALLAGLFLALMTAPLAAQTPPPTHTPTLASATPVPGTTQTAQTTPLLTPVYLPLIDSNRLPGTPVYLPLIDQRLPTPTPTTPVATVKYARINLRRQPDLMAPPAGQIVRDTVCTILQRDTTGTWLLLRCPDGLEGWVDARLVDQAGDLTQITVAGMPTPGAAPSPTPTPTLQPTATPTPFPSAEPWQVEYYDTPYLSEPPVAIERLDEINFDWGLGSPNSAVPTDRFSARFTRRIAPDPAYYRITIRADDGARFWLDGELLMDGWLGNRGETLSITRWLSGVHDLRLEYYEDRIDASLRLSMQMQPNNGQWQTTYYDGILLQGAPLLVQSEPRGVRPLDYAWGQSSPAPEVVPADRWSSRRQSRFYFENGTYRFHVDAQDGVRVYIDDLLVIDAWRDGRNQVENRVIGIGAGMHSVTVEHYNRVGSARLEVWWQLEEGRQLAP